MLNYRDDYFVEFDESKSEEILDTLIEFINSKKEGSIVEYVLEFCENNQYRVEEIAFLISENKTFKNIIRHDCLYRGIIREEDVNDIGDLEDSW